MSHFVSNYALVSQMRGTDWQVYSEATGELRLCPLLHILHLCKFGFDVFDHLQRGVVVCCPLGICIWGGTGISWWV